MKHGLFWRIGLTVLVLGLGFYALSADIYEYFIEPQTATSADGTSAPSFLPNHRISLGLDLKGGVHLTLGVDVEKAIQNLLFTQGQDLMTEANGKGLLMTAPKLLPDERLEFIFTLPAKRAEFDELLAKKYSELEVLEAKELPNKRFRFLVGLKSSEREKLSDSVLEQALKTIRNRIDEFGVAEPDIRKQQDGRIIVQLPGMDDTQRAVNIIGKTAHLEFRLVKPNVDTSRPAPLGVEYVPFFSKSEADAAGSSILAVEDKPVMTGEHISNAAPAFQQDGSIAVSLSFDRRGADIFARVTEQNVKGFLAIILDGKVHSAPRINEPIKGGAASISGNFSLEEATDLALVLRAGSLPAPVKILEERSVGPSLGQESITMGVTAALIGGALTMVFMAIYYGFSGIIANVMLILDVLLVLAGMSLFGATLTLPGIAGIVLTIAMAVDANVLVFERIREELKDGATQVEAVTNGFTRAMRAIVDSNLTTIIAAVILYQFGTGPIRGFAVTLTLGIIASMFTAIFISRIIFDIWMSNPKRKLSI